MKSIPSLLTAVALGGSAFATGASAPVPPSYGTCPSGVSFVRPASDGLSSEESKWLDSRRPQVVSALKSYLTLAAIPGFDVNSYVASLSANANAVPVIGQAYSGGGTRASMGALGLYQTFDSRYKKSIDAKTGGLSQATTYVAGLSGGCEAVMALALNDFPDVQSLVTGGAFNNSAIPQSAFELLQLKAQAGFNLSIADVTGTGQLFYSTKGHADQRFSDLLSTDSYTKGSVPLPFLIMAEGIPQGLPGSASFDGILFPINNATNQTIYEISPIEFGSWQGRAQAFTPTALLGTSLTAGAPVNQSQCVSHWDSSAWVLGAAVAAQADWEVIVATNNTLGLFSRAEFEAQQLKRRQLALPYPPQKRDYLPYPPNETELIAAEQVAALGEFLDNTLPGILRLLGNATIQEVGYGLLTNPFHGYNKSDAGLQTEDILHLVDAGESGQETPIWPLIQPARKMDFLLVADSSGIELSSGWMNGTNLINTGAMAIANNVPFPKLPDVNTFLIKNYTVAPVFFGCNEPEVPLVLYIADAPYSGYSNATAMVATGPSEGQIQILLQNTFDLVSQSNTTWAQCIACGSILRSLERLGQSIPDQCKRCFAEHCWQGDLLTGTPPFVAPPLLLSPGTTFAEWNASTWQPAFFQNTSTTPVGGSSWKGAAVRGAGYPALGGLGWVLGAVVALAVL
ncbi:FabD/lysophospholipase-like protein [Mycena filopes]|nr:FabD/lysophospholipase-like protein [Mycena filopes]